MTPEELAYSKTFVGQMGALREAMENLAKTILATYVDNATRVGSFFERLLPKPSHPTEVACAGDHDDVLVRIGLPCPACRACV